MFKENRPLLTDEFLDELANEINQQYGGPIKEQNEEPINNDQK
ncbi:bacitracin ABC transporter ATP-binding protein [Neobacillus sp. YX16]|nr:bacitracin ABC transporter ATP-binding protein [Neobacillus sp. YX16]WHZ02918.1 bacitracin ABC transporter ATP-binding protein [Neobacillus sp. YX16]